MCRAGTWAAVAGTGPFITNVCTHICTQARKGKVTPRWFWIFWIFQVQLFFLNDWIGLKLNLNDNSTTLSTLNLERD